MRLAGDLSLEATQIIAYAVDRPRRERGEQLRELWSGVEGAPQIPTDSEIADEVSRRFADAREAFVRAARADLGVSDDVLAYPDREQSHPRSGLRGCRIWQLPIDGAVSRKMITNGSILRPTDPGRSQLLRVL